MMMMMIRVMSLCRLFVYPVSPETITYNLAATLALFEPVLTEGVGENFADLNRKFLKTYVGIDMEPRSAPDIIHIPRDLIRFDKHRQNNGRIKDEPSGTETPSTS